MGFAKAEQEDVKQALVIFMQNLSPQINPSWGWNATSDPCTSNWKGVTCDTSQQTVKKIILDQLDLTGTLNATSLCRTSSLLVLSLNNNNVTGNLPEDISNCNKLTHLYLSGNHFSGGLPASLSRLDNLKRFDVSNNGFSGNLPDMPRISGLLSFMVQNNQLTGEIPDLDFTNLQDFNVSNNNLSGPIPDDIGKFSGTSFLGNPGLCGKPLSNACPLSPSSPPSHKKESKGNMALMYSGYVVIGLIVLLLICMLALKKRKKPEQAKSEKSDSSAKEMQFTENNSPAGYSSSSDFKNGGYRSEYSVTSEGAGISTSLVVLSSPVVNGLRFEDLLRAPAELIGRGKHGSLYKVVLGDNVNLVVKRIKEWHIAKDDFTKRMQRIDHVKHPKVLPVVAYYCSKQEKLLVYEYQQNGSLFSLLHGSQNDQSFDWGRRLNVASGIADGLAFMHEQLKNDGIAHGNLKSSNILLNKEMEPCISEYGLMVVENHDHSLHGIHPVDDQPYSTFKVDIYAYGVILLELLTGKVVQDNGFDLARWVHSVVKEEWTGEVFDRELILEGASEERMVNVLQIALKCINPLPEERPSMEQVATMINNVKDDDERSTASSDA